MPILSKRLMQAVLHHVSKEGLVALPRFMDISGNCVSGDDPLGVIPGSALRRRYALQESVDRGEPYLYHAAPSVLTWVMALEHRRVLSGCLLGAEFFVQESGVGRSAAISYLVGQGMDAAAATFFLESLPSATPASVGKMAVHATEVFYREGGWKAELLDERRQSRRKQLQLHEAVNEIRTRGEEGLTAFEKEHLLLSNIRAGDRNGARRILNEMLASIYLSSPKPVVLRAKVIELMSGLTRAAIEDNPLLEPLIERNHRWTDKLIRADGFEALSNGLMQTLDEFIDVVHLHGVNRSNVHVHKALEFISEQYREPISLSHVADHVGLSPCRLAHLVKDFTGKTVLEVIRQVRLRRAQELLDRTSKTCVDIAYEVGFGDQSYFIQHFKRFAGMTPARYRRRQ